MVSSWTSLALRRGCALGKGPGEAVGRAGKIVGKNPGGIVCAGIVSSTTPTPCTACRAVVSGSGGSEGIAALDASAVAPVLGFGDGLGDGFGDGFGDGLGDGLDDGAAGPATSTLADELTDAAPVALASALSSTCSPGTA